MNIMLVVVGERRSEIGLRKAVGASNAAIFVQFLAEGLSMTTLAGTLGGVLGWLLTTSLAAIAPRYPAIPEPIFDPTTVAVIVLSLILVGLVSAMVPASRASRVDPAVSLRSI
jgi:putative ABC transport system permease protein